MMHPGPPAPPASRRRALPLAAAALAAAALSACGSGSDDAASGGPPGKAGASRRGGGGPPGGFGPGGPGGRPASAVPVEVAEIVTGNIASFIETNGALEAEREVDVVSRTGGPITEIAVEEGMFVEEGALLARIDETETRAQVEISRVALAQAETAYERARVSFENQIVSQEVYDAARSALDSARAQLDGALIQHDYTRITAPFAGLIIERAVKFGETVTNGQRLFRISDFEPLLCHIAAPERDLTRLSVDQPAFIEVEAFPGERFAGRVLRVSPVVDAETGTIRVTLEVDRQGRLSPGMFATVRLVTDTRPNAILMPKRALSLDSLADTVFVVEDGAAARRNVTLGYEEDETVEVVAGLDAGDRVIVVGQDGLTDATPVQILAGPGAEEAAPPERRARAAGAGRPGAGPPGAPTPGSGRPTGGRPEPPGAPAREERATTPTEEASPAPAPSAAPPPPPTAAPRADEGSAGPSAGGPGPSPERLERIRERMRQRGLTEEQIEARMAAFAGGRGGGGSRPPGAGLRPEPRGEPAPPSPAPQASPEAGGPSAPGTEEETEEDLEALRQRLRERGLSEEQIERFLARRRRPGEPGR